MLSYQYRDCEYREKMVSQPSYIHKWNPHTKMGFFYIETRPWFLTGLRIDGLVQDYSNSIANALELLQSCIKPSIYIVNNIKVNHSQTESCQYSQALFKREFLKLLSYGMLPLSWFQEKITG